MRATSRRWSSVALVALATFAFPAAGRPQSIEDLERRLEEMQSRYEERIEELERRVAELEAERPATAATAAEPEPIDPTAPEPSAGDADLAALRAAAAAAAGEGVAAAPPASAPVAEAVVGNERNLNRLNPEISFTGDVVAFGGEGQADIDGRELELDLQAALDPFSSTKFTIAFGPEEVEIEEGFIRYDGLATGLGLRAGKMRQTFGALNRWHLHALPTPDYPLVLQSFFGEEGLAQTGLSAEWLLPRPWASANELTLQVTDGAAEPFGGESFDRLVVLGHLKNYWDVSDATYFEWGLSGAAGSPAPGRDTRLWGTDVTLHWQPPARAKYREVTWRTEAMLSERDDEEGVRQEAWGGYTYVEALLRQNLYAGVRYDRVENPLAPAFATWAVEPFLTWWQSEYVRLRLAWQHLREEPFDDGRDRFLLQATWSAGPHKHELY